jgi:hypothetical protein
VNKSGTLDANEALQAFGFLKAFAKNGEEGMVLEHLKLIEPSCIMH